MKLIEDGNFSGWLRIALYVGGVALAAGGLALDELPRWVRGCAFFLGFAVMAVGGISSRAHMLKIKPFDNSYQKACKSYEVNDDGQDTSNKK